MGEFLHFGIYFRRTQNTEQAHRTLNKLRPKAVIFLDRYTDTQIRKRWSDIALQRFYLKMMHLCICFAKKVISLT